MNGDDETTPPEGDEHWAQPFLPEGTIPEKPPPSRSFAPESLTPFKPIRPKQKLPDAPPEPGRFTPIMGVLLGGLLAFAIGALILWVSAG